MNKPTSINYTRQKNESTGDYAKRRTAESLPYLVNPPAPRLTEDVNMNVNSQRQIDSEQRIRDAYLKLLSDTGTPPSALAVAKLTGGNRARIKQIIEKFSLKDKVVTPCDTTFEIVAPMTALERKNHIMDSCRNFGQSEPESATELNDAERKQNFWATVASTRAGCGLPPLNFE